MDAKGIKNSGRKEEKEREKKWEVEARKSGVLWAVGGTKGTNIFAGPAAMLGRV